MVTKCPLGLALFQCGKLGIVANGCGANGTRLYRMGSKGPEIEPVINTT